MISPESLRKAFRPLDDAQKLEIERDVDDELRFHLEMRASDLRRKGFGEQDAVIQANARFGDYERIRDNCLYYQEGQPLRLFGSALRSIVCVSLAVGFAITMSIFLYASVVRLPATYMGGGDWYSIWWIDTAEASTSAESSLREFDAWKKDDSFFEHLTIGSYQIFPVGIMPDTRDVMGKYVSSDYFAQHGVKPILGRTFLPEEEQFGGNRAVILSENFWRARYGRDRRILQNEIQIDGINHTVVGILPASFQMYNETGFFLPIRRGVENRLDRRIFLASGLLRAGADIDEVEEHLASLVSQHGTVNTRRPVLMKSQNVYSGKVHQKLYIYGLGAVLWFILSAVYVFRGQITFAATRVKGRLRETKSLGRGGGFPEEAMFTMGTASVGTIIGATLAFATCNWISVLILGEAARRLNFAMDLSLLGFTVALSLVTIVLLGIAPGLLASRSR